MFSSLKEKTGAEKLQHPLIIAGLIVVTVIFGYLIARGGIIIAVALMGLFPIIIYFNRFFNDPKVGIFTIIVLGFIAIGLTRYIRNVPFGLSVDGFLVLTYVAVFFRYFNSKVNWTFANRDLTYLSIIWFGYTVLQLFNPEVLSRTAWFYAMRGISLYMVLLIPLAFMIFNRLRFLYLFLYIWGTFSILGTLKGLQQIYIGPDSAEQFWLDTIGGVTHILFGELRAFSFFSDAGQFGAAQGAAGVVGLLVGLNIRGLKNKIFFITMGVFGLWGMMISGTRGAMIVPMVGGVTYLLHRKNVRVIVTGGILLALVYVFFAYTYLGQSNSQIRRMRTAFRPEDDASYLVRLETRRVLSTYLASRPLGGGIGSAGDWGKRFSPQGFLAQIATDSWYVQIWAEQGIVGLILHLFILSYILIKGSFFIMFKLQEQELRGIISALACGFTGIMGASYGNGVLGQMPTGILIYLSMAFIFMSAQLEREYIYLVGKGLSPWSLTNNT
ncbi:MAG: O-antigen ligase family protein [Bacteroidetes bacterium]|nr:O-antigen ligase family protein [Bacteroidales bacterium]MBU1010982.1 O-antigen ligase family protein [Bacteroidota bacterium]